MPKKLELLNMVFGKLTVLEEVEERNNSKNVLWLCKCSCGKIKKIEGRNLVKGYSKSCGCYTGDVKITHGMSKTVIYTAWRSMKDRCNNYKNKSYHNYGGRGIKICERWNNSFEYFYQDIGTQFIENTELDRIDVNGNYEPDNCRWATITQQQRNKRNNHNFTFNGETMTIVEWSEKTGIKQNTILTRIRRNWPLEKILLKI